LNKKMQIDHLGRLLHMEVHVVSTYDGVLERVGNGDERASALERLRADHERHVIDITELLREMGEPAPANTPDVEQLFSPSASALRNADSADDAMQALRMAEKVAAHEYEQAREWGVGLQVHDVLAGELADEERHGEEISHLLPRGSRRPG
jgi:rubrerythrin